MHSKVVYTVYKVLNGAGHPTLRFNFRGVGMSEGRYSGGDGEVGDAAAAAAYARARTGVAALWLAGFSFGSWVGAKWAVQDDHLERFIALGIFDIHCFVDALCDFCRSSINWRASGGMGTFPAIISWGVTF